eukprot:gene811-12089_t
MKEKTCRANFDVNLYFKFVLLDRAGNCSLSSSDSFTFTFG